MDTMTLAADAGGSFSRNLRFLCDRHASIAEICREIGINRQQFNKYLSGASFPSRVTLRRICQYFRVDEPDLLRPAEDFSSLFTDSGAMRRPALAHFAEALGVGEEARESNRRLRRFSGYYYSYYTSPICSGMIIRSVANLYERSGVYFSKGLERLRTDGASGRLITSKFFGHAAGIADRIYLLYVSKTLQSTLCLVVLYQPNRSSIDLLTGVFSGVSNGAARQPFAAHIVYEYLGPSPDLRATLRGTGVFPFDSAEIRPEISSRLRFNPWSGENFLVAPHY